MIERNFEALVYTRDRKMAGAAAAAFSELPIDWTLVDRPQECHRLYEKRGCDFVVIDADSGGAEAFLSAAVEPSRRLEAVVLVLTSGAADAALLHRSYDAGFFYPVRQVDLPAMLATLMPLAERRAMELEAAATAAAAVEAESAAPSAGLKIPVPVLLSLASTTVRSIAGIIGAAAARHSLSIRVQEFAASLLSAVGTAWYVNEITASFRGLGHIEPPSPGPTYLVAVSLLLWLCAKHRRVVAGQQSETAISEVA